jgi:hypothetical protein
MNEPRDNDPPHRGHGRSTAASSSAAPRGLGARRRREQYIEDEERLEMTSRTTDACLDTPLHLMEFDSAYIREFDGEMLMRAPNDSSASYHQLFQELEAGRRGETDKSLCSPQGLRHRL